MSLIDEFDNRNNINGKDPLLIVKASSVRSLELISAELFIFEDGLVFKDKGLISRKETTINYKQVSQVSLRKGLAHTTLEIINTGGVGNIKLEHVSNELAEKAKAIIDSKLQAIHNPQSQIQSIPQTDNPLEQLKKLSELKDQGIITSEDFETKKADLLSRI